MYERQSYRSADAEQFWGGLAIGTVDGGKGLVAQHFAAASRSGIELVFEHRLVGLVHRGDGVELEFQTPGGTRHLGELWRGAKVRGTPYNTGGPLDVLLQFGAARSGEWQGCHAVQWDRNAPDFGDRELTNRFTKQSYLLGIVVNLRGERFVDEGEDFRNLTYAKYGRAVLAQPTGTAFQIFDAKTVPLLRPEEYTLHRGSRFEAATLEELAEQCGVEAERLRLTIERFNATVNDAPFDPTVKDGKATRGIDPPKSNWAQRIDTPPFVAYAVTGAITFTFGGVQIDRRANVIDSTGRPIPGVFAAGELVGGVFYGNYPGGSGLMAGSVFGRIAGRETAG